MRERTAFSIMALATNYIRASTPKTPGRKSEHVWKKPSRGTVKINVDASFAAENLEGGTGAVTRDDHGTVQQQQTGSYLIF